MMPELILYLLKANIVLVLFYLAYQFALRRLTFYTLNRFFLASAIIFSALYPFVDLNTVFRKHEELNNNQLIIIARDFSPIQQISEKVFPANTQLPVAHPSSKEIPSGTPLDYWSLLIMLFWTGVTLCAMRLAIQLFSLYRMHRHSEPLIFHNYKFRKISDEVKPFSFWQSIYLNPELHEREEIKTILQHEEVHIKEWHTLDVLLAEISTVFYWFNPGVWLMKQAVKENLEFLADRKVLQSGMDSKIYQYSLLQISNLSQNYSLGNHFDFLIIKKRISMMNRNQSSKASLVRYFFLVPLVIILSLVFTVSKAGLEKTIFKQAAKTNMESLTKVISDITMGQSDRIYKTTDKLYQEAVELAPNLNIDTAKKGFYATRYGILKDTAKQTPFNIRRFGVQSSSTADTPKIAPFLTGRISGVPFTVVQIKAADGNTDTPKVSRVIIRGAGSVNANGTQPLYVVDGLPLTGQNNGISSIDPDNIASISVLKGENAKAQYGTNATNGVIIITLKEGASYTRLGALMKDVYSLVGSFKDSNRLIIIDGKEATKEDIDKLTSDQIEKVNFLIDADTIKKYGEKAKNGVIEITKKSGQPVPLQTK